MLTAVRRWLSLSSWFLACVLGVIATSGSSAAPNGLAVANLLENPGKDVERGHFSSSSQDTEDKSEIHHSAVYASAVQLVPTRVVNSVGLIELETRFTLSRKFLADANSASCPLDFSPMKNFPWFLNTCQTPLESGANSTCCTALLYAVGLAEAEYLKVTGRFRLENEVVVGACMMDLALELRSEGLNNDVVDTCFPPSIYSNFVSETTNCQGIETRNDFEKAVGPSANSSLASACSDSLLQLELCNICVDEMTTVVSGLSGVSAKSKDCLYYTLWYAAGISNVEGPWSPGTAECIMSVKLLNNGKSGTNSLGFYLGVGAGSALVVSLIVWGVVYIWWKRKRGAVHREFVARNKALLKPNIGLVLYSFDEIKAATKNLSDKNLIGAGGFGRVYRGVLHDGMEIAVKQMKNVELEGDSEFVNEVKIINSVRHRNLVVLRGCCLGSSASDGPQRLLVYEFMPNGSLQDYLFGGGVKPLLSWPDRRRLAIGVAKGIAYLHNDTRPPIIHRDIKCSNILLDENLNARVADFGLAKFTVEGQSHVTTAVAGTLGYVAPEYALYGQLTEKSDVYSFGVVLLELMSGRSAITGDKQSPYHLITDWAWGMVQADNLLGIVDERIRAVGPRDLMERFVLVGILCSHLLVAFRPTMTEALKYLEGDAAVPDLPDRPIPIDSPMAKKADVDFDSSIQP